MLVGTRLKSKPQFESSMLIINNLNTTDCMSWFKEYTKPKRKPHPSECVNFKLIKISSCSSQLSSQVCCGERRLAFLCMFHFALHCIMPVLTGQQGLCENLNTVAGAASSIYHQNTNNLDEKLDRRFY